MLSVVPVLPSCGEAGLPGGVGGPGLSEDVASVRQVLQAGDEPTVVVAHSYGGIVTAEAAAGIGSVRHLLLVSSYLPEVGQSLSDFGDTSPAPFLDVDPEAGTRPRLRNPPPPLRSHDQPRNGRPHTPILTRESTLNWRDIRSTNQPLPEQNALSGRGAAGHTAAQQAARAGDERGQAQFGEDAVRRGGGRREHRQACRVLHGLERRQ